MDVKNNVNVLATVTLFAWQDAARQRNHRQARIVTLWLTPLILVAM